MTKADLSAFVKGLAPVFRDALATMTARIAALELKEKGLDGAEGKKGDKGDAGDPGRDGRDALPGLPGKDGALGLNGKDGLGFDDVSVLHDGERNITIRFLKDDQIKEFALVIPCVIYRDIYESGKSYEKGDAVTFGGSVWVAKATTTAKPGEGDTPWRLAVKHGRDGKK